MGNNKLVECRVRPGHVFDHVLPGRKPGELVERVHIQSGERVKVSVAAAERFTNSLQPIAEFQREQAEVDKLVAEAVAKQKEEEKEARESLEAQKKEAEQSADEARAAEEKAKKELADLKAKKAEAKEKAAVSADAKKSGK